MGQSPSASELEDCVAFASVENMRALESKRMFWLAGSRMRPGTRRTRIPSRCGARRSAAFATISTRRRCRALDALVEERLLPGFGYLAREQRAAAVAASA